MQNVFLTAEDFTALLNTGVDFVYSDTSGYIANFPTGEFTTTLFNTANGHAQPARVTAVRDGTKHRITLVSRL